MPKHAQIARSRAPQKNSPRRFPQGLVGVLALMLLLALAPARPLAAQEVPESRGAVYFQEDGPDFLVVGNDFYEIGLRQSNGAIAYLINKASGQRLSDGSRNECLWGISFEAPNTDYRGGCQFRAGGSAAFTYRWIPVLDGLLLNYSQPDGELEAQVLLRAERDRSFSLKLFLRNGSSRVLDFVHFPSDLLFAEGQIESALLPVLPGVRLKPSFFDEDRSYTSQYPGPLFADLLSLELRGGSLAIYAIHEEPLQPLLGWGLVHDDESLYDNTIFKHTYLAKVAPGAGWHSPTVRFWVDAPQEEVALAFRDDNDIERFPSLRQKSGPIYAQLVRSPLIKADTAELFNLRRLRFADYAEKLYPSLPKPSLLHLVTYWDGEFDRNYPDFLPPNPRLGSQEEFAAAVVAAQDAGLLVMPYVNPTWWDRNAPTVQALPAQDGPESIAVLNADGEPVVESYRARLGYVTSPYAPAVQAKAAQIAEDFRETIPMDLLFEDQIGARYPYPAVLDYQPSAPAPNSYHQGWLEHTRRIADSRLTTEFGYDRLAETEIGFFGSLLIHATSGMADRWWGSENWSYYPLAPALLRDKTLFYQHNLEPKTMTSARDTLVWNGAMGYQLGLDTVGMQPSWARVVGDFQTHVFATYADRLLTDFVDVADGVTRSTFGSGDEQVVVTANWRKSAGFPVGEQILAPVGLLVERADGSLKAGIFTAYQGAALSNGIHFLIEERGEDTIVVRQPMGNDTGLTLAALPGWDASSRVVAEAFSAAGVRLGQIDGSISGENVSFFYAGTMDGQPVAYYRLRG